MTTFQANWLSRSGAVRGFVLAFAAVAVAGCAADSNVLGGSAETPLAQNAAPVAAAPQPALTKVAIAPIIGAPDGVGRGLSQEMASAITKFSATVVTANEKSDYTLRGYIVAAKEKTNTKVSYIWDVTDPAGKRLNRITGEELVRGQAPKDPWSAVSPEVTSAIAQKSAASFGAWLPTAAATNGVQPAVASVQQAPSGVQTASVGVGAGAAAAQRPQQTVQPASAAAGGGAVMAMVPSVTGAPGDGSSSLTQALQSELTKNGVALGSQPTATTYRVEGVVKLGASQGGKQPIQIDWNVKDPQGKKLGTVSQKNEIPEGSLDGAWGSTASAAAAAAAQGILKLLPRGS